MAARRQQRRHEGLAAGLGQHPHAPGSERSQWWGQPPPPRRGQLPRHRFQLSALGAQRSPGAGSCWSRWKRPSGGKSEYQQPGWQMITERQARRISHDGRQAGGREGPQDEAGQDVGQRGGESAVELQEGCSSGVQALAERDSVVHAPIQHMRQQGQPAHDSAASSSPASQLTAAPPCRRRASQLSSAGPARGGGQPCLCHGGGRRARGGM